MAAPDVEYRCFVGGLAWATDDRSLEAAFSTYGEILDSKIINDRETGRSRGFGFVTFSSEQSMRDAIEGMNGKELDGRNITVNEAQSRRRRRPWRRRRRLRWQPWRRLRRRLRRELEELIGGAHRGQLSLAIRVRIILSSSRVVIVSSGSLESRSPLSIHPVLGVLRP
ncbi:Os03g0670700 [Oryza sativa Japonica Group]|uniref:Os03g0670700 protein n=1 Tax=Oryza sativa subsp. japonica TaxID=39947 RepID=A0A0P0W1U8_ORYSJ|nr:Os03g0670700 [Oryza sativa Japonica Group]